MGHDFVVIFRGSFLPHKLEKKYISFGIRSWLNNILPIVIKDSELSDLNSEKLYGGEVHQGFSAALESLWTNLIVTLKAALADKSGNPIIPPSIVLCGHSLG